MTESQLKIFILYCQSVEMAYQEWKNYWIDFYTNGTTTNKDLYDTLVTNNPWLKNLKEYQKEL